VLAWSGFVPGSEAAVPDFALDMLTMLYAWLPIAPKLAAIVIMRNFPLGQEAQIALRTRIDAAARSQNAV
jgi:GPH family glycoside/pentoside/hexuronide:cation symporter